MDWLFEGPAGHDFPETDFDRPDGRDESLSDILQARRADLTDPLAGFGGGKLDLWAPQRIADGGNPGDILVTGDRDKWWEDLFDQPGGGGGSSGGGGGGGGELPPNEPDLYDACDDRKSDSLAQSINDEIQGKPDKDTREYGALIWKDAAGNVHRTALVPGTNGRVPWPSDPGELGLDSYSQVIGMVHSHPTLVNLGTDAQPNWVSASYTGIHGGDWVAADGWVNMHGLSQANFTMYISDQGTVREYDYADNKTNSRTALGGEGSTESGDYIPGASCP